MAAALELQQAFWWLEEELSLGSPSANQFVALAMTQLGASSATDLRVNASPYEYGVAVMNFTKDGENRQSMLVRVPDGGLTLLLLGSGVLGCAAFGRRFK